MDQVSLSTFGIQLQNRSRSMGLKLLLVCGLALLMTIPSIFVYSLVEERTSEPRT